MAIIVGRDIDTEELVELPRDDMPIHVLGSQGGGKSHFIASVAEQAADRGDGVLLLDIKDGKLAEAVASRTKHPDRLIYVAPGLAPQGMSWGVNLLDGEPEVVVDNIQEMFLKTETMDEKMTRVKKFLRMACWLALEDEQPTLGLALDILQRPQARRRAIERAKRTRRFSRHMLRDIEQFERLGDARSFDADMNSRAQQDTVESTIGRLGDYLFSDPLMNMMMMEENTFRLAEWLDEGRLVVCNLVDSTRGMPLGQPVKIGNVFMAMFINAAAARRIADDGSSRQWTLVADEFDLLASATFVKAIDKLRAARVVPVLAHQSYSQVKDQSLRASLSGLAAKVYFGLVPADRSQIRYYFSQEEADETVRLPARQARVITRPQPEEEGDRRFFFLEKRSKVGPDISGVTVKTLDWWGEVVDGQLARAIAASHAYLRPVGGTIEGAHDDDDQDRPDGYFELDDDERRAFRRDLAEAREADSPRSGEPEAGADPADLSAGDDQPGGGDPAGAQPLPLPDQPAGGGPAVPGAGDGARHSLHAGGSEGRRGPVDQPPVRDGAGPEEDGLADLEPVQQAAEDGASPSAAEAGAGAGLPPDPRGRDAGAPAAGRARTRRRTALD